MTSVYLGYLRSFTNMGVATVTCEAGCTCQVRGAAWNGVLRCAALQGEVCSSKWAAPARRVGFFTSPLGQSARVALWMAHFGWGAHADEVPFWRPAEQPSNSHNVCTVALGFCTAHPILLIPFCSAHPSSPALFLTLYCRKRCWMGTGATGSPWCRATRCGLAATQSAD